MNLWLLRGREIREFGMDIYTLLYGGSDGKQSACNAGDLHSIPGLGRSPEERNGNPLQYSGLVNSMHCIVHVVAKCGRRDWIPTSLFLGFLCGSAGKESGCKVGDLSTIPGSGRFSWRREWQYSSILA